MTRRSLDERNVRKLSKNKTTISVSLPAEFMRDLKWRAKQKVVVTKKGDTLIIKDWKK